MSNLIQYIIQKDPSKKSLSDLFTNRVVDDYKKAQSGNYQTKKSDVPENWGKKTEAHLNEYLKKINLFIREKPEPDYWPLLKI